MEISIASDVTHQPSSTSPKRRQPPVTTTTTAADPVLDQFQQLRSMISTFLGERDFLTFRNETVKLLSEIQYKANEHKRQVTTSREVTTFQLPGATQATAGRKYILTIPETQAVFLPVVQPTQIATKQPATVIAKVQQPSRPSSSVSTQPATSYVVVDDEQPGTSRQMIFNPPFSCSFATGGESTQHFRIIQSPWSYSKCATVSADPHHSHFHPLNFNQHCHQCHLPLIKNSQDLSASPASSQPKSTD